MAKRILIFTIFVAGLTLLNSCKDYLKSDDYFQDKMTIDKSFENPKFAQEWLAHTYSFLEGANADVASKGYEPFNFSDDMYYGDRDVNYDVKEQGQLSYNRFHLGNYHENEKQSTWGQNYKGIRSASIFIQNIHKDTAVSKEDRLDLKAQARFIRAYYYWLLLRKYGPIPILPDEGIDYTKSYEDIAIPRSSYEECAEYISKEMVKAAEHLPLHRGQLAVARPTRGAALATRAKVLLYAASPLMNGGNTVSGYKERMVDDEGNHLLSLNYDEKKWAKAAAAARDVINLGVYRIYTANFKSSGTTSYPATAAPPYNPEYSDKNWPEGWANIDPFESYRSLFDGDLSASENPELIFTRGQNQSTEGIRTLVEHQLPIIASGWNTHGMTLKMCDAYYMADGSDVPGKDAEYGEGDGSVRVKGFVTQADVDAGKYPHLKAGVSLQFAHRSPRFYASVAFNGSVWNLTNESDPDNRNQQVFYYRGSGNGYTNTMFWLRTGIGIKKYVNPKDTYENDQIGNIVFKPEPALRYADILLEYAEALNELTSSYQIPSWDSSNTYTITRNINEMKRGVRPVRIRAGLPDYSDAVYSSREAFRKKLKRERMIEFMGEQERYYDLRRWLDAPVELSKPIYGYNVLMTAAQKELFHQPVQSFSLEMSFAPKMYFWPISIEELRRNNRLTQNPGWKTYD